MTKHFLKVPLWALISLTLWLTTGCSDDKYADVDGASPDITMIAEHIQSAAGRSISFMEHR